MDTSRDELKAAIREISDSLNFETDEETVEAVLDYAKEVDDKVHPPADQADKDRRGSGTRSDDDFNALVYVHSTPRTRDASGVLDDVTFAVKDNLAARGLPMTCGTTDMSYVPSHDATVVDRLLDAGGAFVGKANMDAFAVGPAGQWSEFGKVENPIDPDRVPGGSSSGSGVAVAAGLVDAALGTDSGGSVRSPAACCGIVGMKPTHGLVPRYGLVDLIPSTDVIGPLARDVQTVGDVLSVIAGPSADDPSTSGATIGDTTSLDPTGSYSIGLVDNALDLVDEEVAEQTREAITTIEAGTDHTVDPVTLDFGDVDPAFSIIIGTEFSWLLRQDLALRGQGTQYNHELRRALNGSTFNTHIAERMLPGAILDEATNGGAYVEARREAIEFKKRVGAAFDRFDALLTPTLRMLPPKHGEVKSSKEGLKYSFTKPFSLSAGPAVTVPIGKVDSLPVSAQIVGAPFNDKTVLDIAAALESVQG